MAIVKLKSCFQLTANPDATTGTNVGGTVVIQLNSSFEPFDTIAHQPYGYDQMTPLYGKYKVLSAEVEFQVPCTAAQGAGAGSIGVLCQAQPPTGAGTLTGNNGFNMAERPNVEFFWANQTGAPAVTWKKRYDIARILGITDAEFNANIEEYAALVSANPTQMTTLNIAVFSNAAAAGQNGVSGMFTLIQTVQFFGRITQATS